MTDAALLDREREFHDEWARGVVATSVKVVETFTASTSPEPAWILSQLGDLSGKRILELGSGCGEGAVYFALQGAQVTATDLSPEMLNVVGRVAAHHDVSVTLKIASATDLSAFPDESFDIVYAANLLHHVDISATLHEVHRVLRRGGQGAFWDPVAYNPLINRYRAMATEVRTEDEHPIRRSDIVSFRNLFSNTRMRYFWLSALIVFVKFYLIDRVHPNADRYWKRILTEEAQLRPLVRPLMALDKVLFAVVPPLRWWAWNIAIVVRK